MTAQRIVPLPTAFALSGGKKRPRLEDGTHLKWIRTLPCLVRKTRKDVQAAHIRYADHSYGKREVGGQEKPDDRWTIPLNAEEHAKQHSMNERDYWKAVGIDPLEIALKLFGISGDDEAAEIIIREARPAK